MSNQRYVLPALEVRLIKTVHRKQILPKARNGGFEELRFLAERIHESEEYIIPEVFEAFLEHLQAFKVPPMETLPTSFGRSTTRFKNPMSSGFLSVQVLGRTAIFTDAARSNPSIGELLTSRWPGLLAWLCYFYVACFEKNLVDDSHKDTMSQWINMAFLLPSNGDNFALAIAEVPGTIRLATLLCMLDNKGSYLNDMHYGTHTLMAFLQIEVSNRLLDEVVGHRALTRP